MKCQNCGVNYLDEDRECPICGARAGSRGRVGELEKKAAAWRERQLEDDPNYRKAKPFAQRAKPGARKARPSAKPMRDKKPGLSKGKASVIAVVVVVLLNLLPGIVSVVGDIVDHYAGVFDSFVADVGWDTYEAEPDWDEYEDDTVYYTPGSTYEYGDGENYVYVRLSDLIDGTATAVLADGSVLELWVTDSEWDEYAMTISGDTGFYQEEGYFWGMYNYPEENMYDDAYPPERYDSLTFCLTAEQSGCDGETSAWYDSRQEDSDLWLIAYVDRETGLITLQDIDETGVFAGEMFATLGALEQG